MVYLVGGICVINIVLWIIFFIKFNKRFSSQKIIEQTRVEMNELVKDMQRNTANNIDLINSSIERLRQINAEAEKKINQLNKKLEFVNSEIATKKSAEQIHTEIDSKLAEQKAAASSKKNKVGYPPINSSIAYKVNKTPQRDLFEEDAIEIKDEVVVTADGAAYREVPVITTKVLDETAFGKPKEKSINDKVLDLYNMGNSVEEIATALSVSTTEVQFIIDLE